MRFSDQDEMTWIEIVPGLRARKYCEDNMVGNGSTTLNVAIR